MPIHHTIYNFSDLFPPVIATELGLRSPRSVELDPALVTGYVGAQGIAQKLVPPGAFAAFIPGSSKFRVLPRTRLTAASSSATLSVSKHTAQFFVPGDTLSVVAPFSKITLAGTWVAGDSITFTVDGKPWTYVVGVAAITPTDIAADIALKIKKSLLNATIEAAASGTDVNLISLEDDTAAFTVAKTSTAGTALPAIGNLAYGPAIGTVQSVLYDPNTDIHQIVLTAVPVSAIPAGVPIGDLRYSPANEGMMTPNTCQDLMWANNTFVVCFTSLTVYGQRLPYWDGQLARLYPEITWF